MGNSLHGRGGEELSNAADSVYLVIGRLTDRVNMGVEHEAIIKKDPRFHAVLELEMSS